jgi:beta-glucanase (GH16 family)
MISRQSDFRLCRFTAASVFCALLGVGAQAQEYVTSTPARAATPAISPKSGSFTGTQKISIADATAGATIYYTTNGATPTTNSSKYTGPLSVAKTETIKALATAVGFTPSSIASASYTISPQAATPAVKAAAVDGAQNGAEIVTVSDATAGATIHYTLDGSVPTTASPIYAAPFLVDSSLTVSAMATATGYANSAVAKRHFSMSIASGTLVWSEEFANASGVPAAPDASIWTYDVGNGGWGNAELEDYCAWGSNLAPCTTAAPNAYVGTDGYLHIVAAQSSPGVYTSARLKTQGLFSFRYGRFEVRAQIPEAQGYWPAAWLLGNDLAHVGWPACGEMDVQERVDAPTHPDTTIGSVHGPGVTGGNIGTAYAFPAGQTAASFHTYGMIWSPGKVAYYVDDPATPYVVYTPASIAGFPGAIWPFDTGPSFIILNLAIGGDYPGSPDASTPFPAQSLIDYVRIYAN